MAASFVPDPSGAWIKPPAIVCSSGKSGAGDDAACHGQAVSLCLTIELCPGDAALHPSDPLLGIDEDSLHRGNVNHQAAVDGRSPGNVVTTTADRRFET